jgi:hypothetical protein
MEPSSLMSDEVHFLNEEHYILFASIVRSRTQATELVIVSETQFFWTSKFNMREACF